MAPDLAALQAGTAARQAPRRGEGPLFPGYIFVELDLDRSAWRSITGTFGVVQLVSTGERPAPVPAGVFEEITARAGSDGLIELLGRKVRVEAPVAAVTATAQRSCETRSSTIPAKRLDLRPTVGSNHDPAAHAHRGRRRHPTAYRSTGICCDEAWRRQRATQSLGHPKA